MAAQAGTTKPYVFISYASADRERVLTVVAVLQAAGVAVWLDQQGIAGGENYGTVIADAIKGAAALVLMASAASLASRNVKQEIALGWRFERPYLPLLLEPVAIPDELAYWLEAAQWIEVLDKPEAMWLPQVLASLAPLGIAPLLPQQEEVRLAGRERELALLREKLVSAKEGKGGLVLIGGEAGIGKTTLAETVMREAARQGCAVIEGHCFDLAETPPYGPWIDLFARYDPSVSLPPPEAFAVRGTVGAVPSQIALFVQVQDFLAALTKQQPLVLLLDDLHWADPASLDLLRFLSRSVATLPLLILVTYRSDELTRRHPLYALLPQLAREEGAERITLGRLDDDAVRNLVSDRYSLPDADTEGLAAYLRMRAEGNALFVGELLRSLEEANALRRAEAGWALGTLDQTAVPPLLRQVIDGRLARLDEESQRLLGVAAVIGHEVSFAVWSAVGETAEETLLDLAERAEEANVFMSTPDGAGVRFTHALIREALYEGLPSVRRRRIHHRVGEALAATSNPDPDAVAYHFQQAGDAQAVAWLITAGERAQAAYAWTTAADRFAAALDGKAMKESESGKRGWLLLRLGLLCRYSDAMAAIKHIAAALDLAIESNDSLLAACAAFYGEHVGLVLGSVGGDRIGRMAAAVRAFDALPVEERARFRNLRTLGATVNEEGLHAVLAAYLSLVGRNSEARKLGEQVIMEAETQHGGAGSISAGSAYAALVRVYATLGMPREAGEASRLSAEAYRALGHQVQLGWTFANELRFVTLPYATEQIIARRRSADEGAEAWNHVMQASPDLRPGFARLPLLALEGKWDAVGASVSGEYTGPINGLRLYMTNVHGEVARSQGETQQAWEYVHASLPDGPASEPGSIHYLEGIIFQRLAASLALSESDLATAKEWLETHNHWLAWGDAVLGQSEGQALWAQFHRQAGDREKAYEHAERSLVHASEPRQPLALIAAHRLLGELNTEAGQFGDAATHLDASLALANACEAPYERALTLLAMAERHAAVGDMDAARTLLEEVRAICEPLGAKPALARAEAINARL